MRDILTILFCHFWEMVLVAGVIFVTVVLITFMSQDIYQSKAKIMLKIGRQDVSVDASVVGPTMNISRTRESEINSELSILSSRDVVEQVVDALGPNVVLDDDYSAKGEEIGIRHRMAVNNIEKNLKVASEKKSNNITVQFYSTRPKLAQQILGKIISVYKIRHIEVYHSKGSLKFFQSRVDSLLKRIDKKESDLAAFKRDHGIMLIADQKEQLMNQITGLQKRQDEIKREMMSKYTLRDDLRRSLKGRKKFAVTSRVEGMPNRSVDALKEKLMDLHVTEADIMASYPETSTTRKKLLEPVQKSIGYLEKTLQGESDTMTEKTTSINTTYQEIVESLRKTETEISELTVEQSTIDPMLEEKREQMESMVTVEREINRMQRDIGYDQAEYKQYRTGLQRSKVSEALDVGKISNVSIIQSATLPVDPISPDKTRNIALGLLIGILAGLGYAFVKEHFDDSIKSSSDVTDHLGQTVLSDISDKEYAQCAVESRSSLLECGSLVIEQKMISLYQTIISLLGGSSPKVIQMMSARPEEGGSAIIRELARVVAGKLGKSVLLIDANRPGKHSKIFKVQAEVDWESALTENIPISQAVANVQESKLSLSTLSTKTSVSPSVIDSPEFDKVIAELSEQYDFIIIDAPPASDATEGLALSPKVSGTILVVEAEGPRWQVSDNVQKRIVKYGGKVLGVILNKRRNYIPDMIYNHL